jgi:hypothetical protein
MSGATAVSKCNVDYMRALATTFSSVLDLDIDLSRGSISSRVIENDKGIYFGLTRSRGSILYAARNQDIHKGKPSPDAGSNQICSLRSGSGSVSPLIVDGQLRDLHQIRALGRWLFVVQGEGSSLAIYDGKRGQLVRHVELEPFVPADMRHEGPEHYPADPYHFNSIAFDGRRALVLAHNWQHGSFALELSFRIGRSGPDDFNLVEVHRSLGTYAHDIARVGGILYVLDSGGGQLITRAPEQRTFPILTEGAKPFPRGLAITKDLVLIGYGEASDYRDARVASPTRLRVLDRTALSVVMDVAIGSFGNSCDILVISERDLTDCSPAFWRHWLPF